MFKLEIDLRGGGHLLPEDRKVILWVMEGWSFNLDVMEAQGTKEFTESVIDPDKAFGYSPHRPGVNRVVSLVKYQEPIHAMVALYNDGYEESARRLIEDHATWTGWIITDSHGGMQGTHYTSGIYEIAPGEFYTEEF